MSKFIGAAILTFTLVVSFHAAADPDECRNAVDQYKLARSDVRDAIRTYASCLSSNDGHDDCSSEFSTLQSAQDDFETAVSEYESDCQ